MEEHALRFPSDRLLDWYHHVKRDLPWRSTSDPYCIWISEVILQQTRVEQGEPYYHRFIERFPDVHALASASEDEVLKMWEGLGYYSRARNLHAAAKQVSQDRNGVFPQDHDGLLALKGVGPYTAAAIGSIAFGLPIACVDGNVNRVIARYFHITESIDERPTAKLIATLAQEVIPSTSAGDHNQAMMELGATVCMPRDPDCATCPLNDRCLARAADVQRALPVRSKKTKIRNRYFHYLIFTDGTDTWVDQRKEKDIWQGLFQFPLRETAKRPGTRTLRNLLIEWLPKDAHVSHISDEHRHLLSHQRIFAKFIHIRSSDMEQPGLKRVPIAELDSLAFPRLIVRYLEDHDL